MQPFRVMMGSVFAQIVERFWEVLSTKGLNGESTPTRKTIRPAQVASSTNYSPILPTGR
uniref:Uncharacterized protein n=1 Tax=viral metagenome TaxID=1070528 RepID=A0A6C0ENU3_9ZZZZ